MVNLVVGKVGALEKINALGKVNAPEKVNMIEKVDILVNKVDVLVSLLVKKLFTPSGLRAPLASIGVGMPSTEFSLELVRITYSEVFKAGRIEKVKT